MLKIRNILFLLMIGMAFSLILFSLISTEVPFNDKYDPLPQIIRPISLKDKYELAGETIPVDQFDVAERLERELLLNTYYHSSMLLHLKLSYRYFPHIEKILIENGIPADLKYLAVAESSLRNAISSSGAKGIWQFKEATAAELGLEVNGFVDERNDFEKSTQAACIYLKQLKNRFGSWTLAAAAYNMGPTALTNAMQEQKESVYFNLNLSEETNRYIFRILAIKEIMERPEKFGFYIKSKDAYPILDNYKVITVNTPVPDLADFAHENQTSYRLLKVYNPWLLKKDLPNKSGKDYNFKIPKIN